MANVIQVLPQALCDQIAAGEVLERAASAVKELVENSLDAGATSIEIELDEGGRKRLSVCDNGCGMSPQDAKLSILRHATSKIRTTADLASISTMGFRGEALASMASVAKLSITTQPPDADIGTYLHVEGANLMDFRETAAPAGTQIVLEDLFFNTPARLKFLKTTATELRRVYEVVEQFALACHEVRWKLTFDGRVKCDFPPHRTLRDRALAVFGRAMSDHLYPVEPTILGDVTVEGLFCDPVYGQSASGRIYTYVNRRIVKDKTIQSAINQAYKEFLHGRQPCVVLFITIPLDQVDVNVHPTKHEIRFETPDNVFRAVYRALRQSLEKTPWIKSESGSSAEIAQQAHYFEMLPDSAFRAPEDVMHRDMGLPPQYPGDAAADARRSSPVAGRESVINEVSRDLDGFENPAFWPEMSQPQNPPWPEATQESPQISYPFRLEGGRFDIQPEASQGSLPLGQAESKGYFSSLRYIGQHAFTYLICADGDNLVIVDQHAAHERINFERLKKVADDVLPAVSQGLLFPILLRLDTRLEDTLNEYMAFFEKLGFQLDNLGSHSYALRAVPEALSGYDYDGILRAALTDLADSGRTHQFEDIRDDIMATMACHKSIRAGQKLSPAEVMELFRLMDETGFRSNCPHGRPVHFVLPLSELEKRFLRIAGNDLRAVVPKS